MCLFIHNVSSFFILVVLMAAAVIGDAVILLSLTSVEASGPFINIKFPGSPPANGAREKLLPARRIEVREPERLRT